MKSLLKLWLCIAVVMLLNTFSAISQGRCGVSGVVVDATTGEAVVGAVVEVVTVPEGESVAVVTSGYRGIFEATLPAGSYKLSVEFLGYETLHREFATQSGEAVNLGTLQLSTSSIVLEDVNIRGSMMRTAIKGDTVVYNASAFKVASGANTHRLLAKMPGVAVSDTGIEVHGRDVRKVFVDGREFFGNDPMAAVKNIPADMIESIETYYHLSTQAELTGVDDGEGFMAINIITAEDKRNGWFGKAQLGWGSDHKGIAGGNINRMKDDQHIALIGLWNNVNQYNFSSEDVSAVGNTSSNGIFNVKPINGVSKVGSFGVNYNDRIKVGNSKMKVSLFYFYNTIDNDNTTTTDRTTFTPTDKKVLYDAVADSHSDRLSHKFGGRIDIPLAPKHTLSIRPSVSWQQNHSQSNTLSRTDNLFGSGDTTFVYRRMALGNSLRKDFAISNSLSYSIRLKQKRETLVFSISNKYSKGSNYSLPEQYNFKKIEVIDFDPTKASSRSFQQQINNVPSYNHSFTATYTRPISRRSILSASYRLTFNGSQTDKRVYKSSKEVEGWDEHYREDLSTVFDVDYVTHRLGAVYKYGKGKTSVTGGLHYQTVDYTGHYTLPKPDVVRQSYGDVVYSLAANIRFNPQNRIKIDAKSTVSNPSPSQLQNVLNTANSQFLRIGNPNLRQSYLHNINIHYLHTQPSSGTSLSLASRLRLNNRYIADELVVDSPDFVLPDGELLGEGNQFAKPQNMRGFWDWRLRAVYGMPLHFIKCNFNIRATFGIGRTPSILNGEHLKLENTYGELGAVLSSNISERLDFSLTYAGRYTKSQTRFMTGFARNDNITQTATGELKYITPHEFTISSSLSWNDYQAVGADYAHSYLLCNIYIGRRVLPRGLGEISIGVNDLFNQSALIYRRTVNTTAISEVTNRGVGRYFAIQFVYNIRHYKRVGMK